MNMSLCGVRMHGSTRLDERSDIMSAHEGNFRSRLLRFESEFRICHQRLERMSQYSAATRLTLRSRSGNEYVPVNVAKTLSSNRNQTLLVTVIATEPASTTVDELKPGSTVVAKIYDPRTYRVRGDEWEGSSASYMTHLYNNEVQSYHRLKALQGKQVPRFLGEFVVDLPDCGETISSILIEYIDVETLRPPNEIMGIERQRLEASATSLLENLDSCGVSHNDIRRENVLWDGRDGLWVVDFGDAVFDMEGGLL